MQLTYKESVFDIQNTFKRRVQARQTFIETPLSQVVTLRTEIFSAIFSLFAEVDAREKIKSKSNDKVKFFKNSFSKLFQQNINIKHNRGMF